MIELTAVISTITSIVKSAAPLAPLALEQAKRNEIVVKILTELKLDPVQPTPDFDTVYVYALVEYCLGKPEPVLQLFREKAIKKEFWDAYHNNCPLGFFKQVKQFLQSQGTELDNWRNELEEFGQIFITVAKRTNSKDKEFEPYPDWNLDLYPKAFKPLIDEKIRSFCGRNFVFTTFKEFRNHNSKGYFTVIGDAGMGKSAIAANYVYGSQEQFPPCYFNDRATGQNKPDLFLESIRKQLIQRYPLPNAERDDLTTLIQKVSEKLTSDEQLLIVVDALDEVEQELGNNLLYLPKELPERVYFLLTRRPYTRETKRLTVSPGVQVQELDLRDGKYAVFNREDIEKYIRFFLVNDSEHQDALKRWIEERNVNEQVFVEQVADKSANNFMYLRYVLPEIAKGSYKDLTLKQLPDGLQDYYQSHWQQMGMNQDPQKDKVIILFILVESGTPITCEMIAAISEQDEFEVENILQEWVEYLTKKEIDGEICYSFYHASFLEFLKGKRELKGTRKLFEQVNQRIADYLYG